MHKLKLSVFVVIALVLALTAFASACSPENTTMTATATATATTTTTATTTATATATTTVTTQQEVIKLTFGGLYPDGSPHTECDKKWIAKIEADTNGRVQINYQPGGTLVSMADHYWELVDGVIDIGYSHVGIQPLGFDIKRASDPWMWGVPDEEMRMDVFNQWCDMYPEIMEEWKDVKPLMTGNGMSYHFITNKPIYTLEDMQGMQMKAMGAYGDWIRAMGGEGVAISMGESYLALQKGILDGCLAPTEVLYNNKFAEVAPYVTFMDISLTPYIERVMNWDAWNSLPPDIQQVFEDNYSYWEDVMIAQFAAENQEGYDYGVEQGVEYIEISDAEKARFFDLLGEVCLEVAAELDAKGYRGTEMYLALRDLIDNYEK